LSVARRGWIHGTGGGGGPCTRKASEPPLDEDYSLNRR
jgi:hypothetical protein